MKKKLMIAFAGATLLSGAFVGGAAAVSENANTQACFGQARAGEASTDGRAFGAGISELRGGNAEANAAAREACQED